MEIEITIPSNTSDITLEQYQMLMKYNDNGENDIISSYRLISVLCKIPMSDVMHIQYGSVMELINKFQMMFKEKRELIPRFELGGVEFGFIPNMTRLSFGEYIDLEKYISDWSTMNNAMAVMYRPVTDKNKKGEYNIEPYESSITYAEVMKAAPLHIVLGAQVFFWNLGSELLSSTMDFLQEQVLTIPEEILVQHLNLPPGGDGISQFMQSLKETSEHLTRLPDYHLLNA